ncbi:MAG: PEP-CTERM sorting domain-containing protein [Verrucomicrobiota bacterium]
MRIFFIMVSGWLGVGALRVSAVTLIRFQFDAQSVAPQVLDPNASAINFTSQNGGGGPSPAAGNPAPGFEGQNFQGPMANLGRFFRFNIIVDSGFDMDLNSLVFDQRAPNTTVSNWEVRYSVDNYSTAIGAGLTTLGFQPAMVNLSDVNLTGNIEFRLYAYGAPGPMARWQVDNVTLDGEITPENSSSVPEPSSLALLAIAGGMVFVRRRLLA